MGYKKKNPAILLTPPPADKHRFCSNSTVKRTEKLDHKQTNKNHSALTHSLNSNLEISSRTMVTKPYYLKIINVEDTLKGFFFFLSIRNTILSLISGLSGPGFLTMILKVMESNISNWANKENLIMPSIIMISKTHDIL